MPKCLYVACCRYSLKAEAQAGDAIYCTLKLSGQLMYRLLGQHHQVLQPCSDGERSDLFVESLFLSVSTSTFGVNGICTHKEIAYRKHAVGLVMTCRPG